MSNRSLYSQIRRQLRRSHTALVESRPSTISGAGTGVFARQRIERGKALCLYPGVHSAGLPPEAATARQDVIFLGNMSTPSGLPPDQNAYVLNLKDDATGYLDGLALKDADGRPLDDGNPSAVAHLVNHSKNRENVEVVSFSWESVLAKLDDFVDNEYPDDLYYRLPNVARYDGAPRFMDGSEMVYYEANLDTTLCGAVFCATIDIAAGNELFLDYGLFPPLPSWAVNFYDASS